MRSLLLTGLVLLATSGCCGGRTCGGACVDVQASLDHCGACFNRCAAGASCLSGTCVCPGWMEACAGTCVDTATSTSHCGGCGAACAAEQSCVAGECTCPAERPDLCGGACVSLASDPRSCGACGRTCPPSATCAAGECLCPGALAICDGACVDTETDAAHCGGCGRACELGCAAGRCVTVDSIAIGLDHSCLLLSDGAVLCWGGNFYGQLGLGDASLRSLPEPALLGGAASAVAVGYWHSCALVGSNTYCWGRGLEGQLGNGTQSSMVFSPEPVASAPASEAMSAQWTASCVISAGLGEVWCWGREMQGIVTGGSGLVLAPVRVDAGPADRLVVGSARICWRRSNDQGVVCRPGRAADTVDTTSFAGATDLAAGSGHICALVAGDVLCAGLNQFGQLGDGTATSTLVEVVRTPVRARVPERAIDVAAVGSSTCALGASGAVYCWGNNTNPAVLGATWPLGVTTPRRVEGVTAERLFCGDMHCCAVRDGAEVWCWGGEVRVGPERLSILR